MQAWPHLIVTSLQLVAGGTILEARFAARRIALGLGGRRQ